MTTKWEYQFIEDAFWFTEEHANSQGELGWELVCVHKGGYYFKRTVEDRKEDK